MSVEALSHEESKRAVRSTPSFGGWRSWPRRDRPAWALGLVLYKSYQRPVLVVKERLAASHPSPRSTCCPWISCRIASPSLAVVSSSARGAGGVKEGTGGNPEVNGRVYPKEACRKGNWRQSRSQCGWLAIPGIRWRCVFARSTTPARGAVGVLRCVSGVKGPELASSACG